MPRDLGKAKRADLSGKFPGEQAEYGSALARFLEGSGQLKPLADGVYTEEGGNGRGTSRGKETEIPRTAASTRSKDTEVAPPPGGNGFADAGESLFDSPEPFGQEEMFPEASAGPVLEPTVMEPMPVQGLEPMEFEPSPGTLSAAEPEPQSLDSVPDLLSPELDSLGGEPAEEQQDDTELLAGRGRPAELAPPEKSDDTGMLIAEAFSTRKEDGWDSVELDQDDENENKITDKIQRRPQQAQLQPEDDDLTSILREDHPHDGEKITNKVEPRRDVDPREADPNAVVRDTVNFYNQTQSFQEARKSAGFPTISPTVVNSTQPLGLRGPLAEKPPAREYSEVPAGLVPDDSEDTDTLRPGPVDLDFEPSLDSERSLESEPDLAAEVSFNVGLEPAAPLELSAESDIADADKRETDKFTQEDREPPQMPLPEGTDKVDKSEPLPRRRVSREPQGLEPLADERVAGGKDTQRFYVAEIMAKKHSGDTTAELQAAEEGPPKGSDASETSADYTTSSPRRRATTTRREPERPPAPEPLPEPKEVHTDFLEYVHVSASERMIPELDEDLPELDDGPDAAEDGDDTVDEEAEPPPKARPRTQPPSRAAAARADTDSGRRQAAGSGRVKRITDALSQRLKQERAETLRLIEEAEAVAIRLRETSNSELTSLSVRREAPRAPMPTPEQAAETVYDLPAETLTDMPQEQLVAERETVDVKPQAQVARRMADRVPTRAIGEIVDELQRSASQPPASLSELLDQASRRQVSTGGNGNGDHKRDQDDDLDLLVAASSRLRETIEEARLDEYPEPAQELPAPATRRPGPSSLSGDLDRLWDVLDTRRTSRVHEPATLLIPAADNARITRHEPELDDGWTQEMLWPTLAGIAVVTFLLGAVFVWVIVKALG